MRTLTDTRWLASGGLLIGVVAVVVLLATGGSSYTLDAHFLNAGGLVDGGQVQIAGRTVGSIAHIGLTANGEADIELSINDSSVTPLHADTRAAIRAVGQAGITNNFVVLTPGPATAATLRSGSVLSTLQTSGIVPIDALLDSFGPAQRAAFDRLIANSDQIYAGSGGRDFNAMLGKLDPALGELDGLTSDLALDRGALSELVDTASAAAGAVASRDSDLTAAVHNTATAMTEVANKRAALADELVRLSPVLTQATGTLSRADHALTALRPTLRRIVPVAGPLHAFLTQLSPLLTQSGPVLQRLNSELPAINQSLAGLRPLGKPAVSALDTLGPAMSGLTPTFTGLRYYGTDAVLGALVGLFGPEFSEYTADGNYAKGNFVQPLNTLIEGPLSQDLSQHPLLPGILDVRTGLDRRCPGGAVPPAPDGSSPWDLGSAWCTAADDEPLSADFP